jgi:hypothetical protein
VTGAEQDGLIQLTREARQPGWWHSLRDVPPNPYEVYVGLEAGAASIRDFEPVLVPGLLQTADYARAIFRNGPIELDPDEVERLLEVCSARQEILVRDNRPRLWAVRRSRHSPRRQRQRDARAAPVPGRVRAGG